MFGGELLAVGYLQILLTHTLTDSQEMIISFLFFSLSWTVAAAAYWAAGNILLSDHPHAARTITRFSKNTQSEKSEVRSIMLYRISPTAPYQHKRYRRLIKQSSVWMLYFP